MRLDPELGRAADEQGGVTAHRFVEFAIDFAGRHEAAHFLEDLEVGGDAGAGFVDVAGAEGDEQVAGLERVADGVVGGGEIRQIGGGDVAVAFHRIDEGLAGDARRWVFPRPDRHR